MEADWYDFYDNVKEEMPAHMPEPRGKSMGMSMSVGADQPGTSSSGYVILASFYMSTMLQLTGSLSNSVPLKAQPLGVRVWP